LNEQNCKVMVAPNPWGYIISASQDVI